MNRLAFTLVSILLASLPVSADTAAGYHYLEPQISGQIRDRRIVEASGLARSHVVPDRLWTMNDGDSGPDLFALDAGGNVHGSVTLRRARNRDWEDLASFERDGSPWLLVADIGDNESKRRFCSLYLVREPADMRIRTLDVEREIRFSYPDGPQDAESVAVDTGDNRALILVKRTVPARLYAVPLTAGDRVSRHVAEFLGDVPTLPQPSQRELDRALADQSWHWQPTAMDIAHDGLTGAILTYSGVYLYSRSLSEPWIDALQRPPQSVDFRSGGIAEAIAFRSGDASLYITVEGKLPPIYRMARVPAEQDKSNEDE